MADYKLRCKSNSDRHTATITHGDAGGIRNVIFIGDGAVHASVPVEEAFALGTVNIPVVSSKVGFAFDGWFAATVWNLRLIFYIKLCCAAQSDSGLCRTGD